MAWKQPKRSSRFPLTLHPTRQWCKPLHGRLHYFGTDKEQAYRPYLSEAAELHEGRKPARTVRTGHLTVKDLANHFLTHQHERMLAEDISSVHFKDCQGILERFARRRGKGKAGDELSSDAVFSYRNKLMTQFAPWTVNRHLGIIKAMFNYGLDFGLVERGPNLRKALAKIPVKRIRQFAEKKKRKHGDRLLQPAEVRELIENASLPLKAMIHLGIGAGLGNTDCADLREGDIDLDAGVIDYHRGKTGVRRTAPLDDAAHDKAIDEALWYLQSDATGTIAALAERYQAARYELVRRISWGDDRRRGYRDLTEARQALISAIETLRSQLPQVYRPLLTLVLENRELPGDLRLVPQRRRLHLQRPAARSRNGLDALPGQSV